MIFGIKEKYIFHTVYFLAIATNIPQRLKTGFVLQGHIYFLSNKYKNLSLRHNSHADQQSVRLHAQYTAYY